MILLKIIRVVLPPFHPLKYKYIEWYFGEQSNIGAWKDGISEIKRLNKQK